MVSDQACTGTVKAAISVLRAPGLGDDAISFVLTEQHGVQGVPTGRTHPKKGSGPVSSDFRHRNRACLATTWTGHRRMCGELRHLVGSRDPFPRFR
jgi:hypothetical protein